MKKLVLIPIVSFLASALTMSCGGSGGGGSGGGGSGAVAGSGGAGGATTGPGQVTVTIEGVTGLQGKMLLGFLYPAGGAPNAAVAGLCIPITASPFSATETMKPRKQGASDPCQLETTPKIVDPGTYELLLGVYTPGSMTPEQCAKTTVEVQGDTAVTAPALGACN